MNVTEFGNNITSWSNPTDPLIFMNNLTGDYWFWTAIFTAFVFILFITMLRRNYDYKTLFIATMFPSAIISILFVVTGLISIQIVSIVLVLLSVAGILFNDTN